MSHADNQTIINAIAERLNALRRKPCPSCLGGTAGYFSKDGCYECHSTGFITDTSYQTAWALLDNMGWEINHIEEWPDGAVRGLLQFDLLKALNLEAYGSPMLKNGTYRFTVTRLTPLRVYYGEADTEAKALGKALLEVLNV